jgi:hypothetical protein
MDRLLSEQGLALLKIGIAAAGGLLCLWGAWLRWRGRPEAAALVRDRSLVFLGIVGGLCWWNVPGFHPGGYLHVWDSYHYFLGAKYFRELGYTRLYDCTVVADAEAGLLEDVRRRRIRDLETNRIGPAGRVLADPGRCTGHFSPSRWVAFTRDVAWFRDRMSPAHWTLVQRDHGYNGTPAWLIVGGLLAGLGAASDGLLRTLALLDAGLLLAMWAAVGWAFGWRAACVAAIYWGTNYPAGGGWTGGAYLRQDWLTLAILALCLLRRGRPAGAGFALAGSALLRIFPGFIAIALGLKALAALLRVRRLSVAAGHRRLAAGTLLGLAVFLPLSLAAAGGPGAWVAFVDNSRKHLDTPAWNLVGLKTLVAYEHDTRLTRTVPLGLEADPFAPWQDARRRVFAERRWLFAALVAVYLGLLGWAVRRQADWVAAVLGVGLIPVAAQVSCYYWSILLAYGFLADRRPEIGAALCGLSAAGGIIALAVGADDVRYAAISAVTLLFVVAATVWLGRRPLEGAGDLAPGRPYPKAPADL